MTTSLIIWLWLSCYVLGLTMQAVEDKKSDISEMKISDHIVWIILAPIVPLPVAIYSTFKRIFNV